jgi:hypothetical protein
MCKPWLAADHANFKLHTSLTCSAAVAACEHVFLQPDPIAPPSIIDVVKKGPSQSIEANTEFTFTLTASVKSGNVSTMVLTDAIEASTGITFVKVAPTTGGHADLTCSVIMVQLV